MRAKNKPFMKKVILLSYGSPERIDDVPEYLSGIFNGKPVPETDPDTLKSITDTVHSYR